MKLKQENAVDDYQRVLKRVSRILQTCHDRMVKAGCYWRVRLECDDLNVAAKKCRVSALCEKQRLLNLPTLDVCEVY